jgi:predicted anti-sigma-YlaC factor YlaD
MTCPMMMSLGVYVLGAADPAERQRLEAHLPGCQPCRSELNRLAPLPGLLEAIPQTMRQPTPPSGGHSRMSRRSPARGGVRRRWAAAAAAAVAAGVTGGLWLSSSGGHEPVPLTLTGANPATHVSATATLTATSWGTSIQLQVRGVPENVECRLVVRSQAGRTEVSGAWDAWQEGPLNIPASASWLPSDIASLQVTTQAKTLVTISVNHTTGEAGQ